MAALFPRAINSWLRLVLAAAVIGAIAIPAALWAWVRTPYVTGQFAPLEQPVEFDHRHHVQDDGIDCRYCHAGAERGALAGVPDTAVCLNCHSQIWTSSPHLQLVWNSFVQDVPIRWRRVHRLPDFVFFNHAAHVRHGVGCETCHGRVDRMARVYQVAPLTMGWCLDCHRNPAAHLRPAREITTMGWDAARHPASLGAELAEQYRVRSLLTCTTCHR